MKEHRGSIDVVPLEELLPEYVTILDKSSGVSVRFALSGDLDKDVRRYRNNRYAQAVADYLAKDNGTYDERETGEDVVRFLSGGFSYIEVGRSGFMGEL